MRDGANCATKGSKDKWNRFEAKFPQAQVTKIEIGYWPGDQGLRGLKFFDRDGAIFLQSGLNWIAFSGFATHTVHLKDGERVIGYKSGSDPNID